MEDRYGCKLPDDRTVLAWAVRHSAWVHSRFHVREDGRTPFETLTCRKQQFKTIPFGECVEVKKEMTNKRFGGLPDEFVANSHGHKSLSTFRSRLHELL